MKGMIMGAILSAGLMAGANAKAAENSNPFGLVYDGAITENVAGKINIHPTSYKLHGLNITANVYTPADYDATKSYSAIVVAHPNGGVKEQVAGLYAQRLAENGYITIAADASYQGASGGEPRHTDKPANREEDIHGMVDFISQYPGVDNNRIGILGICGGGGVQRTISDMTSQCKGCDVEQNGWVGYGNSTQGLDSWLEKIKG